MTHDQPASRSLRLCGLRLGRSGGRSPHNIQYSFDVNVFLLQLEPFIVSLVRHITKSFSFYDWECEDLAQHVRTKLALTLLKRRNVDISMASWPEDRFL